MTFSEKLVMLRKKRGMSQEQLAELLDVSRQSVSKWEAQQALPETAKIIMIANVFDVSIDTLLKDDLTIGDNSDPIVAADATNLVPVVEKLDVMFCTKCGKENRSDSAFCGYCGTPFTSFVADKPISGELTKTDMDLAYYKANLQLQQQALQMQQQELEEMRKQTEQQRQQLKLQRKQDADMMRCPRCCSTSLSGNKKGYGIGKGVIGAALFGPLGLVAGNIGAGKVVITCMKCGHKFKA